MVMFGWFRKKAAAQPSRESRLPPVPSDDEIMRSCPIVLHDAQNVAVGTYGGAVNRLHREGKLTCRRVPPVPAGRYGTWVYEVAK